MVEIARGSKGPGGRKSYHVAKNSSGGWNVKGAGAKRASSSHKTQKAAQKAATKLAKSQTKGQIVIHGRDGKVGGYHPATDLTSRMTYKTNTDV